MFFKIRILLLPIIGFGLRADNITICPKDLAVLQIYWNTLIPYIYPKNNTASEPEGELVEYFALASTFCGCGDQVKLNFTRMNVSSSAEIELFIRHSMPNIVPRLVFPVITKTGVNIQYLRRFLAFHRSPGPAILEYVQTNGGKISFTEMAVRSVPYLIIMVLIAISAGTLVWGIEMHKNSEQFSRPFPHGALNGVWWSFVTMTTVGYGDKSPVSVIGRMVGIIWMIVGTILMSLFNAQITAAFASNEIGQEVSLVGEKVALQLGTENFFSTETNLGGIYQELEIDAYATEFPTGPFKYFLVHDYIAVQQYPDETVKMVKTIHHEAIIRKTFSQQKKTMHANETRTKEVTLQTGFIDNAVYVASAGVCGLFLILGAVWEIRRRTKLTLVVDLERQ
ncbi:potassium voltage-gated channel subfamily F member 1 isoform X2 [Nematostella vectensis]|uniref:potassium voltage-gated channel subfamily F member 1 isoform X2 n=1 Tax=Nematostella vectensis TaxID=45351 RepID=UPI0020775967|nr:potassium voltage-gated channel subfamily F member 1 isoform X2 [Nematostella vectensis]